MAENGSVSPEVEAEDEDEALQKLQKDVREIRETLCLQRLRNTGPEGAWKFKDLLWYEIILTLNLSSIYGIAEGGGHQCGQSSLESQVPKSAKRSQGSSVAF